MAITGFNSEAGAIKTVVQKLTFFFH